MSSSASVLPGDPDAGEPYLIGFIRASIVGLRYYSGTLRGRELVGLVRQPLNPYDANAIMAVNTSGAQVGHLDRSSAAALSPLIDSSLLSNVEAIVPNAFPRGTQKPFRVQCQVHLFASLSSFAVVRAALEESGMDLIEVGEHEFLASEAAVVKEGKKGKKGAKKRKDINALFKNLETVGSKQLVAMEPAGGIAAELFQHQKEALGWMFSRETSLDLPPFWEMEDGGFVNVLTNYKTEERPAPLRSGMLADDMGLGKTLTLLALIATNRKDESTSDASKEPLEDDKMTSRKRKRVGRPEEGFVENVKSLGRKNHKSSKKKSGEGKQSDLKVEVKTTLVVCPPSVFSSWVTQLEEHVVRGCLKMYIYHGERTRDKSVLLNYDIVLTTYSTIASEFNQGKTGVVSLIHEIQWFRIILDEAHLIKNANALQTKAVIALNAERRWVVTGTPIQNSAADLYSLMAFLNFQPFSIKSYWNSLIQRPSDQSGLKRLQALLGAISLRRTKESTSGTCLDLPAKTVETYSVELSSEEREIYDQLEEQGQRMVQELLSRNSVMRNYSTVLYIILRLRQICNAVALCPPDITKLLSSVFEDVSDQPALLKKLSSLVEEGEDFDCPVCLNPPSKAVITSCTHIFCKDCILKSLKNTGARCPICRTELEESKLYNVPKKKQLDDDGLGSQVAGTPISSKASALINLLLASRKEDPTVKSVVFSQFRKMLVMLKEPLRAAGFKTVILEGSMSTKKRSEVMKEFSREGPNTPTVLLASLKACGVGINLTAASRVYFVEPWWNPAVEDQAMDRVHRIGQRNEVKVVRLIAKNTIDERVLKLQERKKSLVEGALGKGDKDVRIEDVRIMLRLNGSPEEP